MSGLVTGLLLFYLRELMKFYIHVILATAGHCERQERLRTFRLPCRYAQRLQSFPLRTASKILHTECSWRDFI